MASQGPTFSLSYGLFFFSYSQENYKTENSVQEEKKFQSIDLRQQIFI